MKHSLPYSGSVGQHNLWVIDDIIPIIIRNKTYGPPMKLFMAALIKAGTWAIMRYLRGLSKDLFNGQIPEDIVDRHARKRSATAPVTKSFIKYSD